jgi:axin 1
MSSKVDQFLSESGGNNFTETAPRPPVPGEENEKESNGGMSTRSSGSHKSQVSHTSGRSIGSNKGDINPATPRKSNIDKAATSNISNVSCGFEDEMNAPLGFEPEGSAANSPPFTENSTPPYLKWAESLHTLLDDREGVQLFKLFLQQEGIGTCSVDFWFACQGLKLKQEGSEEYIQVIKIIHKKFIKSDKLPYVDLNTKRKISESIQTSMDVCIFNEAQTQVEEYMKNDTYPLFLKSDLYIQYVSKEGESPKSSNSSSGSNSARPMSSGPLPTLKEDQELQQDDFAVPYVDLGPPPTKTSNRSFNCDTKRQEVFR